MILADTSAWVDYLRGTRSRAAGRLEALLKAGDLATTDPVRMEVMVGAVDDQQAARLRRLLAGLHQIPVVPADFDDAATMWRTCRRQSHTVRSMVDCVVAAVAIRAGVEVLHADRDFVALARHTPLRLSRG